LTLNKSNQQANKPTNNMKQLPNIIGGLLGLAFLTFGINHFHSFLPAPGPSDSPFVPLFFKSIGPSGFLTFVKVIEITGGILVALPKTRNWGLLLLGPIVVGIIAVNVFIKGGSAVLDPALIAISLMSAFLLWNARDKFLGLLNK
jgi:putative oxidoreductase